MPVVWGVFVGVANVYYLLSRSGNQYAKHVIGELQLLWLQC
ncbi:hypothetical protein [Staphylococcus sp. NAM3COL9]|nr:hypothetical protein [Staphylococcus sp. NAM3COL9]